MKIVDVRCAVIGFSPVVRIITDAGIVGHGEAEATKALNQTAFRAGSQDNITTLVVRV